MKRAAWIALPLLALLPIAGDRLRSTGERCSFDGARTDAAFRVRIDGRLFCGVACAQSWLAASGTTPRSITVVASGVELDAHDAHYVRTFSTWGDGSPDEIRVFATVEEAERRVRAYGGTILTGAERPFGETDAKTRD